MSDLRQSIQRLTATGKGILAADESIPTISKRLKTIGVESTPSSRQAYRELLIGCPNIEQYLCGIILHEETLSQHMSDGQSFTDYLNQKKILAGIKVDQGLVNLPYSDEKIAKGLDSLNERMETYRNQGARFAKWRVVYRISANDPSQHVMVLNANTLAHYAKICQNHEIVPIIEPEILIEGDHSITTCQSIGLKVIETLFGACDLYQVDLAYALLKPNMITSGKQSSQWPDSPESVAKHTLDIFRQAVPSNLAGINFLSGGQTPEQATDNLVAIQKQNDQPWNISFSFARAIQEPCMHTWQGQPENCDSARAELIKRLRANCQFWESVDA